MASRTPGPRPRQLPTREQLRVWRGYIESALALNAEISRRLQQDTDLSPGDYSVLLALSEAPARRLRSSELATAISWERSRLSHHLGRMERRGLIVREHCADDSRGAEVVSTDAGTQAFQDATVPHLRAVRELFVDALDAELLDDVERTSAALRTHLAALPEP